MRSLLLPAVALVLTGAFVALPQPAHAQSADHAVTGIVVDDAGEPLAGAHVSAYVHADQTVKRAPVREGTSTVTAADGTFTLRLPEGRASVSVFYEPWRRQAQQEVEVDGNVSDLRFVLPAPPPKTAVVQGIVTDAEGRPIEGATVRHDMGCCHIMEEGAERPVNATGASAGGASGEVAASPAIYPPIWDEGASVTTGSDGRYSFTTYGGERHLTVSAPGFAQTSMQVLAKENETVTADITLVKAPEADAVLRGRVVDAETGAPVPNAQLSIRNMEWSRYAWTQVDADGSYEIRLLPGWTTIEVYAYGGEAELADTRMVQNRYYAYAKVVDLASGETTQDVELEPRPKATVALVGYVVDPEAQQGVEGAEVSFWNQDTGDWGTARTDATGSFRILVRPGHYTAHAWREGHLGGQTVFTVEEGATQRVDIPLPKGTPRYAPCEDARSGSEGEDAPERVAADCAGATPPMPLMEKSSEMATPGAPRARTAGDDAATAGAREPPGPVVFEGTGGGLPAYDAARANEVPGEASAGAKPVPLAPLAALLAAVAALALTLRRR